MASKMVAADFGPLKLTCKLFFFSYCIGVLHVKIFFYLSVVRKSKLLESSIYKTCITFYDN